MSFRELNASNKGACCTTHTKIAAPRFRPRRVHCAAQCGVCVSKSCLLGERVRDGWYFLLAAKLRRAIRTMTHYKIPIVNKEKENTSANAFVLRMRLAAQRTNQSGGNVSTSA